MKRAKKTGIKMVRMRGEKIKQSAQSWSQNIFNIVAREISRLDYQVKYSVL